MSEHPARGHFLPYLVIPWEASCPSQGLSHPCREFDIRSIQHDVVGNDWFPSHRDLRNPWFAWGGSSGKFILFGCNLGSLRPGSLLFDLNGFNFFHYLWKTALLNRRRRPWFLTLIRLFGRKDFKNGPLWFSGLSSLIGLAFAFWARNSFLFPSYYFKNIDWRSHLRHCSGGYEVEVIEAGWATYRTEDSIGVSWDRGIVGPSKKLPINGWYPSNRDAALGCPNWSTQILELRTFLRSSRLVAEAGTVSREETAKQNRKFLDIKIITLVQQDHA